MAKNVYRPLNVIYMKSQATKFVERKTKWNSRTSFFKSTQQSFCIFAQLHEDFIESAVRLFGVFVLKCGNKILRTHCCQKVKPSVQRQQNNQKHLDHIVTFIDYHHSPIIKYLCKRTCRKKNQNKWNNNFRTRFIFHTIWMRLGIVVTNKSFFFSHFSF